MVKIFFIFILVAFALMYIGLRYIFSTYSGWITLEKKYKTLKTPAELKGKNLKINRISLGGGRWLKNIILSFDTDEGLLLAKIWIFRGSKFNVLIPWREIVACREIKISNQKFVQLMIGQPKEGQIDMEEKDFQKLRGRVVHASFERILES